MSRGKQYLKFEETQDSFRKFEKIKKEKRSLRGRVIDDWLLPSDAFGPFKPSLVENLRLGRVIEVHKRNVFVAEEGDDGFPRTGDLWFCTVAKRHFQRAHKERNFVVVGDRVYFQPEESLQFDTDGTPLDSDLPRAVIQHALIRVTKMARKDPMRPDWEHIMLANIDLIAIVASALNPEVRWGLIDRFLVQAELEKLPVVIILNKVDLLPHAQESRSDFMEKYKKRTEIYRNIGYNVIELSTLRRKTYAEEIKKLRVLFRGKLVGLAGHSGVGKSSIINLMRPEFEQVVDENPDIFYKGRHTTTYNSLLQLGIGGYVIDTPGVRSFDIDKPDPISLTYCFPEMRHLKCQFRECAHDKEINCAVKNAVEQGVVTEERYRSYIGILKGISFREGQNNSRDDALLIADMKARLQTVPGEDDE